MTDITDMTEVSDKADAEKVQDGTKKTDIASLEREQKEQSHRLRQVTLLWLSKVYPAAFNPSNPKPLKRQIEQEILTLVKDKKDVPSNRLIRRAVAYYTNSRAYHQAVLCETHRINLEGKPAEELEQAHKDFSQKRLEEINALLKKRRAPIS